MTRGEVRGLLARRGLAAHRDRGQNFLVDTAVADDLVQRAGVEAGDAVLEIGTGLGVLTHALAARGAQVVTIEIDAGLVRALTDEALLPAGVELVHGDALELDLAGLLPPGPKPKVVANLPYAVASPLLRRLLDLRDRLAGWSVMLQRELADRLLAPSGSRAYGSLSVLHAVCGTLRRLRDVPNRAFEPVPAVASSFVGITPHTAERAWLSASELPEFERLVRAAFGHRRKTLRSALRAAGHEAAARPEQLAHVLRAAGIAPDARAEALDPDAYRSLWAQWRHPVAPAAPARLPPDESI